MRAIDTNVLVRLITRDDARQAAAADTFVALGAWIGHLVLAETTWVLSTVYDLAPAAIATAVRGVNAREPIAVAIELAVS